MSQNKRWSKDEELVVIDCIKKEGVERGLLSASKKINRSWSACKNRWDYYLKKKVKTVPKGKVSRKKWTKEELELLKDTISKNPNNIYLCCEQLSRQLDRTPRAVYTEYRNLKSVLFMTIGKKTHSSNIKNIAYNSSVKATKHSLWSKVKKLFNIK